MWVKRLRYLPGIAVIAVLVLHSTGTWTIRLVDELEQLAYDTRVRATAPGGIDPRIVVIDVDQASLTALGQWPWPRERIAALVDSAFDRYRVAALGFDVLFAEPDGRDGRARVEQAAAAADDEDLRRALTAIAADIGGDRSLARALSGRPVVLGMHFDTGAERIGALPPPAFEDDGFMRHTTFAAGASGYIGNLPPLQEAAAAGGFFSNPLIGEDGITRRLSMLVEHEGALYESLALSLARTYLDEIVEPAFGEAEIADGIPILESLLLGERVIPIDSRAAVQIPFRGRRGSFPYVSAVDVINGTVADPAVLRDRIVLVGTTATGLFDLQTTPMQRDFPGVEVHANVITGILDESFRHRSPYAWAVELASILAIGLLLVVALPRLSPLRGWLLSGAILVVVVSANLAAWQAYDQLAPLAATLLVVIGVYTADVTYGFFVEARGKRQIRRAFSAFLSPALVQQLAEDPSRLRLEGESREMTFLFTDIAGFTSFTERTPPKVLVRLLNEYLDGVCRIVMDHGGTIDKIVGDAVHAIYNAPLDQPDHAARAVRTAIAIDAFCDRFVAERRAEGIDFGITRIGINTGPAVVGNFGGERRFDYTAHGDAINTAARMESVNKHLGTRICVSETTVQRCTGEDLHFRPIGSLVLKGKSVGIGAYEGISGEVDGGEQMREYRRIYAMLETGDGDAAAALDAYLSGCPGDPVARLHRNRLADGEHGVEIVLKEK